MWFFKKKANTGFAAIPGSTACYAQIKREFGEEFIFSPLMKRADEQDIHFFTSGIRTNVAENYHSASIACFESSVYQKIVRLSLSIPVFDSGDREYDSWHDLYLLQDKSGSIQAVYCTGGYRISRVEGYIRVLRIPEPLMKYFSAS